MSQKQLPQDFSVKSDFFAVGFIWDQTAQKWRGATFFTYFYDLKVVLGVSEDSDTIYDDLEATGSSFTHLQKQFSIFRLS